MVNWVDVHQAVANLFQGREASHKMSVLRGLEASGVKGLEVLTKKLIQAADIEPFEDLFTEALVAAVFLRNGFGVAFLKAPRPDMRVEANGQAVFVEVKRIREDQEEARAIEKKMREALKSGMLVEYGDMNRAIEKILSCVQDALPQLAPGRINLVFLWADRSSWEELEFLLAMPYPEEEIYRERRRYPNLSGLIYRSPWVPAGNGQQFYFWKNPADRRIGEELARRLENLA